MKRAKHSLYFAIAVLIMFSCDNKQEPAQHESGFIEITSQQFAADSIQLGEMGSMPFENIIRCNGTIVPLPNGMAKVNAPVPGMVENIFCHNGQFVKKNQVLLEISGNELIDIQKDFAEASATFSRLKNEYERVRALYDEKVTSEKEFIITESEYKTSMAGYHALRMKIESIGFSASKIENGDFYSSYSIKSPVNGYVSGLNTHIGTYIDTRSELIEITDPEMLQLRLSVFAADINKIEKGQKVRYNTANSENSRFAEIISVGVALNNNSKSIDCYASLPEKSSDHPVANQFVESEIITGIDTVNALPSDAIIKTETGHFVLVLIKKEADIYYFDKTEVGTGRQYKGFTEIQNKEIEGRIAVKGIYNILI